MTYPQILQLISKEASLQDALTLDAAVRVAVEHWAMGDTVAYGTQCLDRLNTYTVKAVKP